VSAWLDADGRPLQAVRVRHQRDGSCLQGIKGHVTRDVFKSLSAENRLHWEVENGARTLK
jgi:hypothetical protein